MGLARFFADGAIGLADMTDEATEGCGTLLGKRIPDWSGLLWQAR